jgi:hypothetical protein
MIFALAANGGSPPFVPISMNGPLLLFVTTSKCCGAARRTRHSLQLQNL